MLPYLISLWITVALCMLLLIVIPIQCTISGSEIPELFEPEYIAELKANGRFRSFIVCVWIILAIVTGVCVCVEHFGWQHQVLLSANNHLHKFTNAPLLF